MARESRGIEVFGRGATIVEQAPRERTPALGGAAVLIALIAIAALTAAIVERTPLFTWIALGASVVAAVAGLIALLTGRGRLAGLIALVLGALANPWVLTQLLEWGATL
jgi:hypothetical protein